MITMTVEQALAKITPELIAELRERVEEEMDAADSMDCPPHSIYFAMETAADILQTLLDTRE